jgi:mono/diheme cytochrome c family protein
MKLHIFSAAAILFATAALCASEFPTARPIPWENHNLRIGLALYRENCAVCHDVDAGKSKKLGPSFYHLFQRARMPLSNGKPTRSYVAFKTRVGGRIMPSFAKKLTAGELGTLIDYLQSR